MKALLQKRGAMLFLLKIYHTNASTQYVDQ